MRNEIKIIERKKNKINVIIQKALKWEYKNNDLILQYFYRRLELLEEDLECIS